MLRSRARRTSPSGTSVPPSQQWSGWSTATMTLVSVVTGAAGAMGSACALSLGPATDVLFLTDCDERGLASAADRVARETGASVQTVVGDIGRSDGHRSNWRRASGARERCARSSTPPECPRRWRHGGKSSGSTWWAWLGSSTCSSSNVVPGSAAVCLASISGHLGAFDPEMDAVLDAPLAADFGERFRSRFAEDPDPGSTYRLAKRGVIRLCERAAVTGPKRGRVGVAVPRVDRHRHGTARARQQPDQGADGPAHTDPFDLAGFRTPRSGARADIAAAVAFLCSEDASFVSGCDIRVDGGLIAAMQDR